MTVLQQEAPADRVAPERSLEQRFAALKKANNIRTSRAELKREIKAGSKSVRALLWDPPESIETMKVYDLLLAMPKHGRVKVNRVLTRTRISPSKTVGGLSERQRRELVGLL